MRLPRLAAFLVRHSVPRDRVEDALGDLEEVHRSRVEARGPWLASLSTTFEAVEWAAGSTFERLRPNGPPPMSWIDVKLGVRMLAKYPGLTLVGGLAMAFAIFVGAACFEFYFQVLHPRLPLDDGERVVMVELLDDRSMGLESRILYDFSAWRAGISTIEELGAAQPIVPNLVVGDGSGEPIRAAAITASAFRMTRVPPLRGRALIPTDESWAAPDVLVIGHDLWQSRFGGDSTVVGRTVVVGNVERTVVGIMPPGFGFPVDQEAWIPLRINPAIEPVTGPPVLVFGRLIPGASPDQAQREIDAYVGRAQGEHPDVYRHLHGRVAPYAEATRWGIAGDLSEQLLITSINVYAGLFLVLLCGNVALLMFARAAAREGEIVVRAALGASRRRIIGQLFSEALALSVVAGIIGVVAAGYGLRGLMSAFGGGGQGPFWYHASLSPQTVAYAAGLTVFSAMIAGVIPGLKITSGGLDARLRSVTSGGGGLRFGGVWTAVIVLQVAVTVTLPVVGRAVHQDALRIEEYEPRFASGEFLTARLALNPDASVAASGHLARTVRALEERLEAEPSVAGVTLVRNVPGAEHPWRRIEVDGGGEAPRNEWDEKGTGRAIWEGVVAPDFFEVLGIEALVGRTFHADDVDQEARTVVVNQPFVDEVLGGRNPIGRQIRYLRSSDAPGGGVDGDEPSAWYRIVGVVPTLGVSQGPPSGAPRARFYHAVQTGSPRAPMLLVHVNGDAAGFATRLREISAEVDPDLALLSLQPLDLVRERDLRFLSFWVRMIVLVSALAVLLSLAGIYSIMSFTVARRTREIGVRVALGAGPVRVVSAIFRRPLIQIAAGLLAGLVLSLLVVGGIDSGALWGRSLAMLLGYAVVMSAVCLTACVVPTMRALRVEPSEALGADG